MAITFWKSKPVQKANDRASAGQRKNDKSDVKSFRDQQQKERAFLTIGIAEFGRYR